MQALLALQRERGRQREGDKIGLESPIVDSPQLGARDAASVGRDDRLENAVHPYVDAAIVQHHMPDPLLAILAQAGSPLRKEAIRCLGDRDRWRPLVTARLHRAQSQLALHDETVDAVFVANHVRHRIRHPTAFIFQSDAAVLPTKASYAGRRLARARFPRQILAPETGKNMS